MVKPGPKIVFGAVMVAFASAWIWVLVLRGLVYGGISQRGGIVITLYRLGCLILSAGLAAYLVYYAWRMLNPKTVSTSGFGWGKILVGVLILYVQVGFDYHLVPEGPIPIHKPSNPTEAASVLIFDLIAAYLIFRGVWAGSVRDKPKAVLPPQS
jgi:vacuolar-type H+-ATPase subunit I/STV1